MIYDNVIMEYRKIINFLDNKKINHLDLEQKI